MTDVYVSTGAFAATDICQILEQADALGLRHIELSSGVAPSANLLDTVMANRRRFRFLVHNYFPPPRSPFLLNLASADEAVAQRSMALCRAAVDLCQALGAPFYSVHCGFTFDSADGSHLGNRSQMQLPRISMDAAMDYFIRRLSMLCHYAESKGVMIAIENNAIASFGLIDGMNQLCLGADLESLTTIFNTVNMDALRLLFDVGHAQVNQQTIGAEITDLFYAFQDRIVAMHVSDNDGFNDQNRPLTANSPLWALLNKCKQPRIVESYALSPGELSKQVAMLSNM